MIPSIMYPKCVEYDFMKQRPHHLLSAFARLGIKSYFFNKNSGNHGVKKRRTGVDVVEENLFVVNDVNNINISLPLIYYYTFPPMVDDPVRTQCDFSIFDSVDEPSGAFAHWRPDHRRAIRTSDLVLASAQRLYDRAAKEGRPTILIPNGVDFDMFNAARIRPEYPPHELRPIKKPIIGYYGAIGPWMDLDLLAWAARRMNDYHFVVIGPEFGNQIIKDQNTTIIPFVPYEKLPRYLAMFDVCVIPFKQDMDVVKSCNPLKYWEYLAAGKPVVTTDMPECRADISYVSKTPEEFFDMIDEAVYESQNPIPGMYEARIAAAMEHSWDLYAQNILRKVKELRPQWDFPLLR